MLYHSSYRSPGILRLLDGSGSQATYKNKVQSVASTTRARLTTFQSPQMLLKSLPTASKPRHRGVFTLNKQREGDSQRLSGRSLKSTTLCIALHILLNGVVIFLNHPMVSSQTAPRTKHTSTSPSPQQTAQRTNSQMTSPKEA